LEKLYTSKAQLEGARITIYGRCATVQPGDFTTVHGLGASSGAYRVVRTWSDRFEARPLTRWDRVVYTYYQAKKMLRAAWRRVTA
jgi:hypothetical protein